MSHKIKVVIADFDLAEREKLKQLLSDEAEIEIVGEAKDSNGCLKTVRRVKPNLALIREDLPGIGGLDVAEQIIAEKGDAVAVLVVLSANAGMDVMNRILRAGIKGFITRPIDKVRLLEEVRRVATLPVKSGQKASDVVVSMPVTMEHQIISVIGPRGGCGKTVLATNLAASLVHASEHTALVDFNLFGGDIAMLLDLTPRRTIGDLLPGFGGIDADVVESVLVKHSLGMSVLAAPLTATFDGTPLSRAIVHSILEVMKDRYQYTIVDTGSAHLESTLSAMDYSDVIIIVVGMDLPRLRDAKHYLKNLQAAGFPREKLRVVVNRSTSSQEIAPSDAQSILEFPVAAHIPTDDSTVMSSINLGQPFVISSPHKPVAKATLRFAADISPAAAVESGKKRAGWLAFLHLT